MDDDLSLKKPDVGRIRPVGPDQGIEPGAGEEASKGAAPSKQFEIGKTDASTPKQALSPIESMPRPEQMGRVNPGGPVTMGDLQGSFKTVSTNVDKAQQLLQDPYSNYLRKSQQSVLQEKVDNFNGHLQSAYNHMGMNYQKPTPPPAAQTPAERFIGLLTSSQTQLHEAEAVLSEGATKGGQIDAASMMKAQLKMNTANQEILLFTNILGKGLEGIKTIMGIQI